jgi:hypothetical protein
METISLCLSSPFSPEPDLIHGGQKEKKRKEKKIS